MKMRISGAAMVMLFVFVLLGGAALAVAAEEIPSNTGRPQTGMYTPGGKPPQVASNSSPSVGGQAPAAGAVDNNAGAGEMYFDDKTYTWKRKNKDH